MSKMTTMTAPAPAGRTSPSIVPSVPPTRATRRKALLGFLAAGLVPGAANALSVPGGTPQPAAGTALLGLPTGHGVDPVFAAIERHRAAWADYTPKISALEDMDQNKAAKLIRVLSSSNEGEVLNAARLLTRLGSHIDTPEADAELQRVYDVRVASESALTEAAPTTIRGAAALLRYIDEFVDRDEVPPVWPSDVAAALDKIDGGAA